MKTCNFFPEYPSRTSLLIKHLPSLSQWAGRGHQIFALQGSEFPTESVKWVSVQGMLAHLHNTVGLDRIETIYGSTSGNTGIAAAQICRDLGITFVGIVDNKIESEKVNKIRLSGGKVIKVAGGVHERIRLSSRLARVDPTGVDLDQYNNPGALAGHFQITGPLIWSALKGKVDSIVVAIGTGGTFGGIAAYLTQKNPQLITVPVDAKGSMIIDGVSAPRYLTGIGCSFIPKNVYRAYQFIRSKPQVISDEEAFSSARWFQNIEDFGIGGSSGAVVRTALNLAKLTSDKRILMVFHDGEDAYRSTVYSDEWMVKHGFNHLII